MQPDPAPPQRARRPVTLAAVRDVLLIATLLVLGLYAGAGFLMPLALAVLVFVLIIAVSDRIQQISPIPLSTWLANLIGVAVVLSGLFVMVVILGNQAAQFTGTLTGYEASLDSALSRIIELIGTNAANAVRDAFVKIDLNRLAMGALGGARSFLSTFFLICFYVAFLMAERTAINRKILLAAGDKQLGQQVSDITMAISNSLQRYVGVKSFVSLITSLFSYGVFRYLGLEFAETWAVLTFALNFIPSIGSVIAVFFPAVVSLLQFDTAAPFLIIVLGCGTVQFLIGNLLDPAMLGRSLNISTFMVILALTFWSAVWGITGAFLSTPLTVCMLIVFSHIPATRPLAILMSQDGTLNPTPENESEI